jgi:peptidoglycan/LPS O-acetylase OafA/YrhL
MLPRFLHILDSRSMAVVFAIFIYGVMFCTAALLVLRGTPKALTTTSTQRVGSLDGLRGMLAIGVFVHHSVTELVFIKSGAWSYGPNSVLNELGQTTVALFFMITGFLFTVKTMSGTINWRSFYIGRVARLVPLYVLIVTILFLVVFALTRGAPAEPALKVLTEYLKWISFVVFGRPDINGYPASWTLIAGVNWSLKYEVIFYAFGVPLLVLVNRTLAKPYYALALTCFLFAAVTLTRGRLNSGGELLFAEHFLGGIITAYVYSIPALRRIISLSIFRWLAAAAACHLALMYNANSTLAIVYSAIIFSSVVGGASVFGILKMKGALWLGDISYGIYLIHGLVLWCGFRIVGEHWLLNGPSALQFLLFAAVLGAVVVLLASSSYLFFELPAIAIGLRARRGPSRSLSVA